MQQAAEWKDREFEWIKIVIKKQITDSFGFSAFVVGLTMTMPVYESYLCALCSTSAICFILFFIFHLPAFSHVFFSIYFR